MTSIIMPSTPGFRGSNFYLETNTQVFEGPITLATQRMELGGARWRATYTLPQMKKPKAAAWIAFFLQLKGRANTFNAYDPDWKVARGTPTGTPLVAGGSQTGNTLAIDGCTASVTGWLLTSDYFSVAGEMKRITQDANTDGSGQVTLHFEPPLRDSPADNAPLTVDNPTCTMALADDTQGSWPSNEMGIYQEKTFNAVEVFS